MSDHFASEQSQNTHHQPGSAPGSSVTAEDPAASLRAAALLTLKSKRRKALSLLVEPMSSLPPRSPAVSSSIQLDYGQEEPLSGASSVASAPTASTASHSTPPPASDAMEVDEGQAREEGEISDSETAPPTPVPRPARLAVPEPPRPPPQELVKQPSLPKAPPPLINTEPVVLLPLDSASSVASASEPQLPSPALPYAVDANHVRPGLSMNQAQYDAAKDIVLDLLGWGVPPEYLVNCGLTRAIVYYVFVELNLRLPSNLDTTGILSYEPTMFQEQNALISDVAPRTDPTSIYSQPSIAARPGPDHPSLPPRPAVPQGGVKTDSASLSSKTYGLSVAAPSFVPGLPSTPTPSAPTNANLLDMEQQRRQELLARKAVLDSRRLKQQSLTTVLTPSTPTMAEPTDVEMAAEVPKSVDDFLKSIEPAGGSSSEKGKAVPVRAHPLSRTSTFDDMDIDEPIPGLSAVNDALYASPPSASPSRSMSMSDNASPITTYVPAPPSSTEISSSTSSSTVETSDSGHLTLNGSDTDMDAIPGLVLERSRSGSMGRGSVGPASRRSGKRPVAADFVDMEPGPSRSHSSNGHRSGHYHSSMRRKHGSFAGINGMRRCVINLSDSEDEIEHTINGDDQQYDAGGSYGGASASSSHLPGMLGSSRVMSPSSTPSGFMSPSALLAKEAEIRKMRELISQREQTRLRKLATLSRRSTPPTAAAVKREEDDSLYAESLAGSSSHSTEVGTPNVVTKEEQNSTLVPSPSGPLQLSIPLPESVSASDSSAATPIDVIMNSLEHATTGDKVLTAEARQEQVVNGTHYASWIPSRIEAQVDVVSSDAVASAQIDSLSSTDQELQQDQEQTSGFTAYSSPLDCYPTLRPYLQHPSGAGGSASVHQRTNKTLALNVASSIDLEPLKMVAAGRVLMDPTKRICRYEIPGGGECRDRNCEDVHLSRLSSVEPNDEETAQYLYAAMPTGSPYSAEDLLNTLSGVRRHSAGEAFDDRVSEALASLGLR
ncbi:hypothetical protein BKA93DRAFT_764728 [Sparassis latifolia]